MQNLLQEWPKIKEGLLRARHFYLFLDFDGTLAPIADTPQKAFLPGRTRLLLEDLSLCPFCRVAIVSGRKLSELKNKVGLEDIIYAGNHGFEVEGQKLKFKKTLSQQFVKSLERMKKDLLKRLSGINGAILEDKGFGLALHYRLAEKGEEHLIKTAFHESAIPELAAGRIKVRSGKKSLEAVPAAEWNKGKIVLWLLSRQRFFLKNSEIVPVYIGDDTTDEDAFKALKEEGLTVFVGKLKSTAARYHLNNTGEVENLLEKILEVHKHNFSHGTKKSPRAV